MNIDDIILSLRSKENAGLGRIFRELRKKPSLSTTGDIILYKKIINTLSAHGFSVEERSITRHFKNIDKEDYDIEDKAEIIKDLKLGAQFAFKQATRGQKRIEIPLDRGVFSLPNKEATYK